MQFKVGDRVEVLTPAEGVGKELSNEVGVGTIKAIGNDLSVKVELPGNFHSWWYKPEQLRHAVEEIEIHPTPSITVGTQVRLTGVVTKVTSNGIGVSFGEAAANDALIYSASILEVIRQPFKRGEVVWHGTTELSVLADEEANTVLLVEPMAGAVAFGADANLFERRP